jgi:hypothetical protein
MTSAEYEEVRKLAWCKYCAEKEHKESFYVIFHELCDWYENNKFNKSKQ